MGEAFMTISLVTGVTSVLCLALILLAIAAGKINV
jgi:hypothetical protein